MASFQIRFAYNNPEYSDSKVLLTTEPLETCRARLAETSEQPSSRRRTGRSTRSTSDVEYAAEEIDVSKLVLCAHSEYFKAAFSWGSSSRSEPGTSKKRLHNDEAQVVVMSLASEAMFPIAHAMIRFMYLRQLEDSIDRAELLQLFKLADEYGVADLRCASLDQLNKAPLEKWYPAEVQQMCEMADTVACDSNAEGGLGTAASAMIHSLAARFTKLEVAWHRQEQRELFCSLPYAIVHQILGSPDLLVKSENTVLIAALSWLRSAQGRQATLEERREVLQRVRLLQLSPWFLASLLQPGAIPEALELLQPKVFGKLVRQLTSSSAACREHQEEDQQLASWAEMRSGAAPGLSMDMDISMQQQDVVEAVLQSRKDNVKSSEYSECAYFDGMFWQVGIQISHDAGNVAKVWAGVRAYLFIGVEFACIPTRGLLKHPINAVLAVRDAVTQLHSAAAAPLGRGFGRALAMVGKDDDPEELLQRCLKDGKLTVQATLQ